MVPMRIMTPWEAELDSAADEFVTFTTEEGVDLVGITYKGALRIVAEGNPDLTGPFVAIFVGNLPTSTPPTLTVLVLGLDAVEILEA